MNASYLSGFGDGDGSIYIGKCTNGFQLFIDFNQCNMDICKMIQDTYGGNVYMSRTKVEKLKYYVKITQKSDPQLLVQIQKYLGYGSITPKEPERLRFFAKDYITDFHKRIKPYSIMKIQELETLVDTLGRQPRISRSKIAER